MATRVFVDGQEGTTGLRIHEYLAQPQRRRGAARGARAAQGRGRARAAAERRRRRLPLPARRGGARGGGAGHEPVDLPDRREHRAPHRQRLGLRPARARARPARAASAPRKRIANPGLPRDRLHPAGAPAGRCRPAVVDGAAQRDVDHRLLRRRQEDDRAVRGRRRPARSTRRGRTALALDAQAPARDDGAQPARDAAGLHADRRQLPEGPVGRGAAAPGGARSAARRPSSCTRRWPSATPASASFASCRLRDAAALDDGYFDVQALQRHATASTCSCSRTRPRCC